MTRRTDIDVLFWPVGKGHPIEHHSVALGIDRPIARCAGGYAISLTRCGCRSIRVAGIGNDRQALDAEHVLCRLGHRIKLARVIRLVGDLVIDNEAGIGVDGCLHVGGRRLRALADPHCPGIQLAFDQGGRPFGIESGGQAIKLGAPFSEGSKCCGRRVRCFGGFMRIVLI